MVILTGVVVFVSWMLYRCFHWYSEFNKGMPYEVIHAPVLEIVWTRVPAYILWRIAFPSVVLLYSMEEQIEPSMTRKIVGHQWYWSYEYADWSVDGEVDGERLGFDAYMSPVSMDKPKWGGLNLLDTDNKVVRPVGNHIRMIGTASDVLHSWGVPALGCKMDCVPGRRNMFNVYPSRLGEFLGECYEICGVGHGFMPINVHVVPVQEFRNWVNFERSELRGEGE